MLVLTAQLLPSIAPERISFHVIMRPVVELYPLLICQVESADRRSLAELEPPTLAVIECIANIVAALHHKVDLVRRVEFLVNYLAFIEVSRLETPEEHDHKVDETRVVIGHKRVLGEPHPSILVLAQKRGPYPCLGIVEYFHLKLDVLKIDFALSFCTTATFIKVSLELEEPLELGHEFGVAKVP